MKLFPVGIGDIHFIGIGGIGMSGIAEILNNLGYSVRGSDVRRSAITSRLEKLGVNVFYGHATENVIDASVVVVSSSIKKDNCELVEARNQKIPVIKRAEMLGELMRLKKSIAVSGTHGKTTTTSLVAHLLDCAEISPTVINGGVINSYGSNARLGCGEWVVAEADESDGSFNKLPPTIAIVTNIDADHMENFSDLEHLKTCFLHFVEKIPFYGVGILCIDNDNVRDIASKIVDKRILTYGFNKSASIRAENVDLKADRVVFDVVFSEYCLEKYKIKNPSEWKGFSLSMVGIHNVQNALSAIAIALELEISASTTKTAFSSFSGIKRRFTKIGELRGAQIIDDYAHHPTEIAATLNAARTVSKGNLYVVVQPHRYSRLKKLFDEFVTSLSNADYLYVLPVYSAGEEFSGIDHKDLVDKIANNGHKNIQHISCLDELIHHFKTVTNNDIILFLGAGDISQMARDFVAVNLLNDAL